MSTTPAPGTGWPLPRGLIVLLGTAAAVLTIGGLRVASDIIGPVFLALVLTVAVHPMRGYVTRHGGPAWAGTVAAMLTAYVIVVLVVASLVYATAQFAGLLPQYTEDLQDLVTSATGALSDAGFTKDQMGALNQSFDPGQLLSLITEALTGLLGAVSSLFFLLLLLMFLALDAGQFPGKLSSQRGQRPAVVIGLESFATGTRRYLVVATVFGFVVAVLDTIFLSFTPIPDPLLWGFLAFITNYIPNIGFVVGLVPPAVLGLLEGGPGLMVLVIVVYSVLNAIIQSVIQPRVVGEVVGLSGSITFVSLVFWAWVLGAVGALFAVPLTLLVKALLVDVDREAVWLSPLMQGGPAPTAAPPAAPAAAPSPANGAQRAPGEPTGDSAPLPAP